MKITVHGELNISRFTENNFAKSRFTATMEVTIHEEKISHFTFHGKKGDHESRKYPLLPSSKRFWQFEIGIRELASCHCFYQMVKSCSIEGYIDQSMNDHNQRVN